jgi:hypothetical protein
VLLKNNAKKRIAMKTTIIILLLIALTGSEKYAFAQTKNNFSDWNVPPPLPPGNPAKGEAKNKTAVIPPLTDVPPVTLPKTDEVKIPALPPVLLSAPVVSAPEQPLFPDSPFQLDDIPLPLIPDAPVLPQQNLQDQLSETDTELPVVASPEMPDFPNIPDITVDRFPNIAVPIPLLPAILKPPVPGLPQWASFSFTGWAIPPVPSNVHFALVLPQGSGTIKSKPKTTKKVKRANKGNN